MLFEVHRLWPAVVVSQAQCSVIDLRGTPARRPRREARSPESPFFREMLLRDVSRKFLVIR